VIKRHSYKFSVTYGQVAEDTIKISDVISFLSAQYKPFEQYFFIKRLMHRA